MMSSRFSKLISALFFLVTVNSARAQYRDAQVAGQCLQVLTDVMIRDITSPLVASRDYAYTMIAFYEAARYADNRYFSYAGQLNGLTALPAPDSTQAYDWQVAGATAFYKAAYAFVFSKDIFQKDWNTLQAKFKKRTASKEVYNRSVAFGEQVAAHIIAWSKTDNYIHTRTLQRFTPSKEPGTWQQTAPDYMEAIEPYWNQIRPMVLEKPDAIAIPAPAAYKSDKFMAECKEVFDTRQQLSKDQNWIANFWDCNPFATRTVGHLMYSIKKLSPGGHWMGIAGVAVRKTKQPLVPALATYSLVSIALFDAFIACWDVKYKTNYIRPVTAIQQLMAPSWDPVLQTPPFPEYPSGHSVISMASAAVLTSLYGEAFAYTDNTEKPYGVDNRSYTSFYAAASEAAISRLYGGIHFREAVEIGSNLGKKIGDYIVQKINIRTAK
jgi:membrane-associated phospholipid phosphatase